MNRIVLRSSILCAMAALLLSSCSHKAVTDWQTDELVGKVRQVTTTVFQPTTDSAVFAPVESAVAIYNRSGYKTEAQTLTSKGVVRSVALYSYKRGQLQKIQWIEKESGKEEGKVVFTYDNTGLIAKTQYDVLGHRPIWNEYVNDEQGRGVEERQYMSSGVHVSTLYTTYDSLSRVQREVLDHHVSDKKITRVYSYDRRGRKASIVEAFSDKPQRTKHLFAYDEHGNCIEEDIYEGNQMDRELVNQYDYDEQGNWTRKVTSVVDADGVQTPITQWTREVVYY